MIGRALEKIPTPALVLDLDVALRNIGSMASRMSELPSALRPHIKVHKCAELARLQIQAGAIGVTTATVAEAVAMAKAGVSDILVANQVVTNESMRRLLEAARTARVCVAVDEPGNLVSWGRAASEARLDIGVLVEVDVGLGRGGVRSRAEAVRLAMQAAETPGIRFEGLYGYEGHCASEPDATIREAAITLSMGVLEDAVRACRDGGLDIKTVSAGATGTFERTGMMPEITEVQAGSYIFMDHFHQPLVHGFEFALTVLSTVLGRHDDLIVLDAGRKSVDVSLRPLESPDPRGTVIFVHEEHVGIRFKAGVPYEVGDRVHLVPGYAPTTVNLFGVYHVVQGNEVVDMWPVLARHGVS